ncbi:IS110 family transposase [Aminobacter ciceronei]|uniref:IS110 family transposase n=1 Tax=Aminobacter ciceronei TaxID=150723 RepID=UPI003F6FCE39
MTVSSPMPMFWWNRGRITVVRYEPIGAYHPTFKRKLAEARFALFKVNPRLARRFAQATGRLAKTDRLDAAMLARMGALLDLEARGPVRSPILDDFDDLHMAREALVNTRRLRTGQGRLPLSPSSATTATRIV